MRYDKLKSTINNDGLSNYTHYLEIPLKSVGCWDWYEKPIKLYEIFINNIYLSVVLFVLVNLLFSLTVHLYTEWTDIMSSLDIIADGLPLLASVLIVSYFAIYKDELYSLIKFMNGNFKWHSARGLTNMTMMKSYKTAVHFAFFYTACTLFSVAMYVFMPVLVHLWTKQPLQHWIYVDVTYTSYIFLIFLRQCLAQVFVALALGQLGVFFACNSILLCGQLDLLCCSLRNTRYTALLKGGVEHGMLVNQYSDIEEDGKHNYLYNESELIDSEYHYDVKVGKNFMGKKTQYDIYSTEYDKATNDALRECARICQVINEYKDRFENFVSPLLVLRVVQVTLYLCTLLYAATLKFDMVTVEYLGAVALDIYVYCYFGNQIILQGKNFMGKKTQYDIYSTEYDKATNDALRECARICQVINEYKDRFENFVSPLLVLRVVQVTLYLCTLLYAATLKFDMVTVEYLGAVALDIYVYCYFGNQIILQADRVSSAAYQSAWPTMGVEPRRLLLNILLANLRPVVVRAGRFLPMNLHTFVVIIKTSFSYYTLLVNVNEK